MGKYLAGVAAGALGVALAMPATAEVTVSGFMYQDIGLGSWVDGVRSVEDLHLQNDSEITFQGVGHTDGGLEVTATIEMDADSDGGIDESHLAIAGGFGKIILGVEDNAAAMLGNQGIGNSYAGTGYYDGGENYTPAASPGPIASDDALGIRYLTPSIQGFQAGISYQVESEEVNQGGTTNADNDGNTQAVGMSYTGEYAGTLVALGANWSSVNHGDTPLLLGNEPVRKQQSYGLGVGIGFGATALNLRYDHRGDAHASATTRQAADRRDFGIGVDHSIGALTFGVGYGVRVDEDSAASLQGTALDTRIQVLSAGAKYDFGGGLEMHAAVTRGDVENAPRSDGAACYNVHNQSAPIPPGGTCYQGEVEQIRGAASMDDVGAGLRIALNF